MSRKLKLTFQAGSNGRTGRWKKNYKGKVYYLGSGRSKSDTTSYKMALAEWEKTKIELDQIHAHCSREHEESYKTTIQEWELVLSWALRYDEAEEAEIARSHLEELKTRLRNRILSPLSHSDRVQSKYEFDPQCITRFIDALKGSSASHEQAKKSINNSPPVLFTPAANHAMFSPEARRAIWMDRLECEKQSVKTRDQSSIQHWIEDYLNTLRAKVQVDDFSLGKLNVIKSCLLHFEAFIGKQSSVDAIDARILRDFHSSLLADVAKKKISRSYAKDRMDACRRFVRWLWEHEIIADLPKNIDSRDIRVSVPTTTPNTYSIDEVQLLLKAAKGSQHLLHILLALNCGMLQKDIAEIPQNEVDWNARTLIRKRNKTKNFPGVPTVTYRLWPETYSLLVKYRSDSKYVLVSQNGGLLMHEYEIKGKYCKNDSIRNAMNRLRKKANTPKEKSFKHFRKTSATLIKNNERFRGLEQLFLGQAPRTISDKHYSADGPNALDAALSFLHEQYGIKSIVNI